MVAFLTLLPVVQCMLFGMTVGRNPKGLKLAVSNEEGLCGDPSLGLIDTFNCSSPSMMSCRYMTMLKELQFETVRTAKGGRRMGELQARSPETAKLTWPPAPGPVRLPGRSEGGGAAREGLGSRLLSRQFHE